MRKPLIGATSFVVMSLLVSPVLVAGEMPTRGEPAAGNRVPFAAPAGVDALQHFLRNVDRSSSAGAASATQDAVPPLFYLVGPSLQNDFWSEPAKAGNTLVLQGKMMIEMGRVLVQHGRALLCDKAQTPQHRVAGSGTAAAKIGTRLASCLENGDIGEAAINVVVVISNSFTRELEDRLRVIGFQPSGVSGHYVSGSIALGLVSDLAKVDEVVYIDLPSAFQSSPSHMDGEANK